MTDKKLTHIDIQNSLWYQSETKPFYSGIDVRNKNISKTDLCVLLFICHPLYLTTQCIDWRPLNPPPLLFPPFNSLTPIVLGWVYGFLLSCSTPYRHQQSLLNMQSNFIIVPSTSYTDKQNRDLLCRVRETCCRLSNKLNLSNYLNLNLF